MSTPGGQEEGRKCSGEGERGTQYLGLFHSHVYTFR